MKWIIKNDQGRVTGPYSTEDVLGMIRRGELKGTEMVARFPGTDWFSISSKEEFYDQILATLEKEASEQAILEAGFIDSEHDDAPDVEKDGVVPSSKLSQNEEPPPRRGKAERVNAGGAKTSKHENKKDRKVANDSDVIELKQSRKVLKKAKRKSVIRPLLYLFLALGILYLFIPSDQKASLENVRLVAPKESQSLNHSEDKIRELTQSGVSEFVQDSFSNLLRAQDYLVRLVEGDPKNSDAYALLCLTYLGLWPYAHQDSQDLSTVSAVNQLVSRSDPGGVSEATCRIVDLYLRRRVEEAESATDSFIERASGSEKPPISIYYLKARILRATGNASNGLGFASSARQFWPQWLGASVLEAELAREVGRPEEALQILNQVLSQNPSHSKAQILLGLIELKIFKNMERGQSFLQAALASDNKAPPHLVAEAHAALAEVAFQAGKNKEALELAKKSYSLDSTNEVMRALILQLGGEKSLKETQLEDRQLVYEGDQLVREGNCGAAQALYQTAFDLNSKNAMAALKAAECLWELGLATQAIDWLNKSIQSDPRLVDAYVLLADFYSQRYLFQAAARSLSAGNGAMPNNYKIYRGYALLELRRRNANGAIDYAQRALKVYEADVDSYVVLARAEMLLGDYNKALLAAKRAQELDVNHREAQIVLANTLFGAQGPPSAIHFMSNLVDTYPLVPDYRLALADIFVKDEQYDAARSLYEQVLRLEAKPKKALIQLGHLEVKANNLNEATKNFVEAAALDPSDAEPLYHLSQIYLSLQKPIEAKKYLVRVYNINKDYPLVHFGLGKAALLAKDIKGALVEAEKEKAKNPKLADPYILAAEAHFLSKQYSLCAQEYQQAVKLRPLGAGIYVQMATCYRLAGQLDAAVSMIRIARSQESGNAEVWRERALIYETRGDNVRAVESYNQYLVLRPNALDAFQIRQRIDKLLQ